MEIIIQKREIEGTVIFYRGDGSKHVHAREIKVETRPAIYQGLQMKSVNDFLGECLATIPNIEGKRVRVSIEVIE